LRLRRDQLIQLIKTGWEKHDRNEQVEETEHKNKDSLAAFIVNAVSSRSLPLPFIPLSLSLSPPLPLFNSFVFLSSGFTFSPNNQCYR
jgi:hypothetical protein